MIKKFTLAAIAAAALTTASFGFSASAEAQPNHWKRWHQQRRCVTNKVWRHHHWVVKKICWNN